MGKKGGKSSRKGHRGGGQAVKQANSFKRDNEAMAASEAKSKGRKAAKGGQHPVAGLTNLGNTCFFNAVLQSLSRTRMLKRRLNEIVRGEEWRVELTTPHLPPLPLTVTSTAQPFTTTLHQFLVTMTTNTEGGTLNPKPVFDHIINKAPRFRSYQQQDSQELLRYLLDALRNEEVYRLKRAILDVYKVSGAVKKATDSLTEKDRKAIKEYGIAASMADTFVDRVFGGQLASSVTCSQCNTCSVMTEGFLDLSLSMPDTKPIGRGAAIVTEDRGWRKKKDSPPRISKHQLKSARREQKKIKRMNKHGNKMAETQQNEEGTEQQPVADRAKHEDVQTEPADFNGGRQQDYPECSTATTINSSLSHHSTDSTGRNEINDSVDRIIDSVLVDTMAALTLSQSLPPEHPQPEEEPQDPQPKNPLQEPQDSQSEDPLSEPQYSQPRDPLQEPQDLQPEDPLSEPQDSQPRDPLQEPQDLQLEDPLQEPQDHQPEDPLSEPQDPQPRDPLQEPQDLQLEDPLQEPQDHQPEDPLSEPQDPQPKAAPDPFSIEACLHSFCSVELLTDDDQFACQECTRLQQQQQKEEQQEGQQQDERQCLEQQNGQQTDNQQQDGQQEQIVPQEEQGEDDDHQQEDAMDSIQYMHPLGSDTCPPTHTDSPADTTEEQSLSHDCDANTSKESDELSASSSSSNSSNHDEQVKMVLCDATHQLLISRAPDVLCLHIKRFSQQGRSMRSLRKNSSHIAFPLLLDMAPYCTPTHEAQCAGQLLYSLYGVVEHSGNMHGGHYTAFICHRQSDGANEEDNGQWYHISDSHVRTASVKELLKAQAYILFYERIDFV